MQHKWKWILSAILLYSIGWLYFWNPVLALVPLFLINHLMKIWLKIEHENHITDRLEQFQMFLSSIATFLNSGNSLEIAFQQCWRQLFDLFGENHFVVQQLNLANAQFKNGVQAFQVINQMFIKFELEDAALSAHAIMLLTKKGGNLGSYFYQITEIIREKFETNQEIRLVRAQKSIEAIVVCCMPILFLAFLKLSSPDFIRPLYSNLGHIIMGCSLLIWILCIKLVYGIVSTRFT
jgi:tight adherence protein B